MQLRRLRRLLGHIAEENGSLFAFDKTLRDLPAISAGFDRFHAGDNRFVLELCSGLDDGAERRRQRDRRSRQMGMQLDQRIVAGDRQQADLAVTLSRQLPQTLCK